MQSTPLSGIRVLEFGGYISLPYATSMLCALGADVVKVERTGSGDDFRRGLGVRSAFFRQYNSGKRSLAVDLKRPEGIEVVKNLIPRFDVVVENMRPGKMRSLGLGPEDCTALRPDLVYASVTGFGSGGPLAHRPAYDTIGQAYGGLLSVLSNAGAAQLSGAALADLVTGMAATTGILAALVGRTSSGKAQHVETSLMEAVSVLTVDAMTQYFDTDYEEPTRQSRHPQAQNFVVKTAAGDDLVIHLSSSPKFWSSFLGVMERQDLAGDPRFASYRTRCDHYFELATIVEAEFLRKTSTEWEELLTANDVPYAPVLTMSEYVHHPQMEWLELIEPEQDGLSLLRPPWRFGGERPQREQHVAAVGEHTREITLEAYDEVTVERLIADGILYTEEVEAMSVPGS
jgi:crotonobetainyl-CoA:carnitine CoA-transferase CaiB-like acyl-CoA transferase